MSANTTPDAAATPRTVEQAAQECAARFIMYVQGANNVIERRADYLALVNLVLIACAKAQRPLLERLELKENDWYTLKASEEESGEIISCLRAERDQLRAHVADLENDLEKSKHEADDWHRAWETVTEQAMKEVAELEQALAASATKAAAEYGEQLKPLFAKVRELEAAVAWAEQQLLGDSGTGETYWETVPGYAAFKRAARAGRGAP